jgi:polygalacturonase
MKTPRRDFLRAGLAAAAFGAARRGWAERLPRSAGDGGGLLSGWDQVPGILAKIVPPQFPDIDFLVTDYGAIGDGKSDCAPGIRAAIEACHEAGGGRVVIPAGNWLSNGPVHLLSNVNLYLESDAVLTFGTEAKHYLPVQPVRWQGIRCYNYSPLIYAYQQENIAVTGSGKIDAQGTPVWSAWINLQTPAWTLLQQQAADGVPIEQRVFGAGHYLRPTTLDFYECNNILVQGITIADSPFWTMHPTFCTNVTIQEVTVTQGAPNDDGCDPDSCTDVWIAGCTFSTVDDNISIKAGENPDAQGLPGCTNIVVQNCNCIYSDWSSLTVGTNIGGGVGNVFMENCTIGRTRNAHYLKAHGNWAGSVENVYFRNNQIEQCYTVLAIQPDAYMDPGSFGPPAIDNINMQSVTCEQATEEAFILMGDPRLPIFEVSIANVAIRSAKYVGTATNVDGLSAEGITVAGKPVTIG